MNGGIPSGVGGFEGAPPPPRPENLPSQPQVPKVEKPMVGQQVFLIMNVGPTYPHFDTLNGTQVIYF